MTLRLDQAQVRLNGAWLADLDPREVRMQRIEQIVLLGRYDRSWDREHRCAPLPCPLGTDRLKLSASADFPPVGIAPR